MKTVKLTCQNGYSWKTSVHATSTVKSLNAYFVGKMFNTAAYPSEIMSKCIECEILN